MPSIETSVLALDRLNLNENDVISHLCSVAVEKCQDRAERRRAGCGGQAMRKRVLIKNFVAQLIRKQQDMQEDEMDEEREESEEDTLNTSMVMEEEEEEEEEVKEEEEELPPTQVTRHEWYDTSRCNELIPTSPSPPLDENEEREEEKSDWALCQSSSHLLPSASSMAIHLRDPYKNDDDSRYETMDPYTSSFFLSPPSDDDSSRSHWGDDVSSFLPRPPSRLSSSPPYSIYDDVYSSPSLSLSHTTSLNHNPSFDMSNQLDPPCTSIVRAVCTEESDEAFLALGGERPLEEMKTYSEKGFDSLTPLTPSFTPLSSSLPSSPLPSPSSTPKKRRSDECDQLEIPPSSPCLKRLKL